MTPRYYAQFTETDRCFASVHQQTWQVFDRNLLNEQGAAMPVCLCINRAYAFKIRGALNKAEAQ